MNKKPKVQVHRTPPTPSAPNSVLGRLNSQMLSTNITMGNPSMQVIGICINLDRKQQGKKGNVGLEIQLVPFFKRKATVAGLWDKVEFQFNQQLTFHCGL